MAQEPLRGDAGYPMKIVFISSMEGAPWGGSEALWSQAAAHLARAGHQVIASVKRWPTTPAAISQLQQLGVRIFFRDERSANPAQCLYRKLTAPVAWRRQRWEEQRWLRRLQPDLVCVSDGAVTGGSQWLHRCLELAVPYVALAQANSEHWWPNDRRSELLRMVFDNARRIFFVSHANRELFERQLALKLPHAEVVWNPFQVSWHAAPPWPAPAATGGLWDLACVGRLQPQAKGQDLILQLLAMPHWREQPIRVTFYGRGDCEQGLRRLADLENLTAAVHFAGHVDDVEAIWRNHQALILPSRYEGLPLAVVEAMLCNRLVVATAVAGTPEVLEHGRTGFLAAAATVPLLDAAMTEAWEARDRWESMGVEAGRRLRQSLPQDPGHAFASRLEQVAHGGDEPTEPPACSLLPQRLAAALPPG